ncbi:hypothetical protein F5Y08DRAFT_354276, partial [Xylaria arbuscula]
EQHLALDLTYGNFTFTQAKVIDVAWDTVIGQGGRLFHGWILYRCIIYPLLVLAMEISTVTYPYYTTLSFSQASFKTLVESFKMLRLTRSYSILFCTILLIYTLTYTLLFPLVWSAATGYVSLSHKLYAMPGDEIVSLDSEHLSLCWVLDPTKLNLSAPLIEIGPDFSTLLSNSGRTSDNSVRESCLNLTNQDSGKWRKLDLQYGSTGWKAKSADRTIWDVLQATEVELSQNFVNIQWYAIGRQTLQIGLNASSWLDSGWEADLNHTIYYNSPNIFPSSSHTEHCESISGGLHSPFRSVSLGIPSSAGEGDVVNISPYNDTSEKAFWSNFLLNKSTPLRQGIVPYNSTIQLNDTLVHLDAPFLDLGFNCSSSTSPTSFDSLGNCVCYKGNPISLDLLSEDKAICNTAPGYVWGFSSYLTRLGLILEATWMLCCFVAYPWLLFRGKLLHIEPIRSAKVMRLILDCSEAICNDIGSETKSLREDDLVQLLKNIKIGYNADTREGTPAPRLVSGSTTNDFSERFQEGRAALEETLYETSVKFDTLIIKSMPIIDRMGNSSVHERMNKGLERSKTTLRSYLSSGKRRPTSNEVYEDIRWQI